VGHGTKFKFCKDRLGANVLKKQSLHTYRLQQVQGLQPDVLPKRLVFSQCILTEKTKQSKHHLKNSFHE
jgi:hypothetical protein